MSTPAASRSRGSRASGATAKEHHLDAKQAAAAARLERKRLSDRQAQRTIRDKTKKRIAELESALEALLSTNINRRLKETLQENIELRDENAQLKRRLETIVDLCRGDIADGRARRSATADAPHQQGLGDNLIQQTTAVAQSNEAFLTPSHSSDCNDRTSSPVETLDDNWTSEVLGFGGTSNADGSTPAYLQTGLVPLSSNLLDLPMSGSELFWPNVGCETSGGVLVAAELLNSTGFTSERPTGMVDIGCTWPLSIYSSAMENPSLPPGMPSEYTSIESPESTIVVEPRSLSSAPNFATNRPLDCGLHQNLSAGSLTKGLSTPVPLFKWIRSVVERYRDSPAHEIDHLIPRVPCIASYFGLQRCGNSLSKELAQVMRDGHNGKDPSTMLGAYFSIHYFFKYLLHPSQEAHSHTPITVRPSEQQKATGLVFSWFSYLPWLHLREIIRLNPHLHNNLDLKATLDENIYLYWPYELKDAVKFDPAQTQRNGWPSSDPDRDGQSCSCTGPFLTEKFQTHILQTKNWRLRNIEALIRKYPELSSISCKP